MFYADACDYDTCDHNVVAVHVQVSGPDAPAPKRVVLYELEVYPPQGGGNAEAQCGRQDSGHLPIHLRRARGGGDDCFTQHDDGEQPEALGYVRSVEGSAIDDAV